MRRDNSSNITQLPGEPDHAGEHWGSTWDHASSCLPQVSYAWWEPPAGNSVPILGQTLPFPPTSPSMHRSTEQSTTVAKTDHCTLALPRPQFPHLNFFIFIFLVLSLYCYQPISLHPHTCMLSQVTPWTAARQAPLSMDFSKQEYWSGLLFPSPSFPVFKMRLIGLDDMRHLPVLSPGPLEGRMHGNDVLCSKWGY